MLFFANCQVDDQGSRALPKKLSPAERTGPDKSMLQFKSPGWASSSPCCRASSKQYCPVRKKDKSQNFFLRHHGGYGTAARAVPMTQGGRISLPEACRHEDAIFPLHISRCRYRNAFPFLRCSLPCPAARTAKAARAARTASPATPCACAPALWLPCRSYARCQGGA